MHEKYWHPFKENLKALNKKTYKIHLEAVMQSLCKIYIYYKVSASNTFSHP